MAMETNIAKLENKINSTKKFHYNIYKKIFFFFFIIEFILSFFLHNEILSSSTLYEKSECFAFILLFSIIISILANLYRLLFEKIIKYNEKKLNDLYIGLDKLFDERKKETNYENTKKLLEQYESFKNISGTNLLYFENCGNCIGKMPSEFAPNKIIIDNINIRLCSLEIKKEIDFKEFILSVRNPRR
ncbi:hypothetical protein DICPUDRAFT_73944 [Dictyostelium purpureum]|uniref:SMODS and SLOG-associating 2TM effector domain-containing protein n=1 Tax=Dictyostelium purpureum TaxID=5786 RepID=F0Z6B4_DICPU|nr:uncharacterized protein DICPUDRAFT_73944 [Dictyostelium purpureum]EGC40411.1 hypothetical protein DICPUDRAFT_73944 [Dictyostelium purpureum]|eukprot:XP_003282958.1 hypothetical protein DICPUDRAFT_73944 [Dictyostelium purpureum]